MSIWGRLKGRHFQKNTDLRIRSRCRNIFLMIKTINFSMKTAALRKSLTSRDIEMDFRGDKADENLPASAGDSGDAALIPWLGRCSGGGNDKSLQYSSLGNPTDREAW